MDYLFTRDDGATLLVDSDLWLCALDLAARGGWAPAGTEQPGDHDPLTYWEPHTYVAVVGQRITNDDALRLAGGLDGALPLVSESEVPWNDKPFSAEGTEALLRSVAAGEPPPQEREPAAAEILSGPPKADARRLVTFLRGGGARLTDPSRSDQRTFSHPPDTAR